MIHHHHNKVLEGVLGRNRKVALFDAMVILHDSGKFMVSLFIPAFLYKEFGFPLLHLVLLVSSHHLVFALFNTFSSWVSNKIGVRNAISLSSLFLVCQFILIASLGKYPHLIYLVPIVSGFEASLYWQNFHRIVCKVSKKATRGRFMAMFTVIIIVIGNFMPAFGGLMFEFISYKAVYITASALVLLTSLPLLFMDDIPVKEHTKMSEVFNFLKQKGTRSLIVGHVGHVATATIGAFWWPLFIFFAVGASYAKQGLIIGLSTFILCLITKHIGKLSDSHSEKQLIKIGTVGIALAWGNKLLLAVLSVFNPFMLFAIDSYHKVVNSFLSIPAMKILEDIYSRYKTNQTTVIVSLEIVSHLAFAAINLLAYFFLWSIGKANYESLHYTFLLAIGGIFLAPLITRKFSYKKK